MSDRSECITQYVCLNFGGADCTYIETSEDYLDDEDDLTSWFAERGISDGDLADWASKNLTVIFDGEMDDKRKFESIKAVGVYGPNVFEKDQGAPTMSGFAVYLEVESVRILSEEELEDIFHLIVPVIEEEEVTIAFTEFYDYSVLQEVSSDGVRPVNVIWTGSE
jgi:hypothetical protein